MSTWGPALLIMKTPGSVPPEAAWYDVHYEQVQARIPDWYLFLLPELRKELTDASKLLELGCGQGHVLRQLVAEKRLREENVHGIDQSKTAVEFVAKHLPAAHLQVGDISRLEFPNESFDLTLLMETIEHLENPHPTLAEIHRVLKPGGRLFLSFPNYLHFPWWIVRILAEKLNHPNWIVLQPIYQFYTMFGVRKLLRQAGFEFEGGTGSIYGPPLLYRWEPASITQLLNRLGLYWLSFHPILQFRKISPSPRP
jgi:2-polyprenyl-3-methyl-5-hydroxy-6-metoxy-1,4-benzoquinol methylase